MQLPGIITGRTSAQVEAQDRSMVQAEQSAPQPTQQLQQVQQTGAVCGAGSSVNDAYSRCMDKWSWLLVSIWVLSCVNLVVYACVREESCLGLCTTGIGYRASGTVSCDAEMLNKE